MSDQSSYSCESSNCNQQARQNSPEKNNRGRPKKYTTSLEMPSIKNLFSQNSSAFLSAILYYVSKVNQLFGKNKNKGFLLYNTDYQNFSDEFNQDLISNLDQRLWDMCRHFKQLGPHQVVKELFDLIKEISIMHPIQLKADKYVQYETLMISFTDPVQIEQLAKKEDVEAMRTQIRSAFNEFITIITDIVGSELEKNTSKYYQHLSFMIKQLEQKNKSMSINQPMATKRRADASLSKMEPELRKAPRRR